MIRSFHAPLLAACVLVPAASATAAVFVSSIPENTYTLGTVPAGYGYTDPAAALGKPRDIVGLSAGETYTPTLLTPFSPHYGTDQVSGIGLDGSITFQFPQAIAVTNQPQIGVFTYTGLNDQAYPDGSAGASAQTFSAAEFNAHRTAVVEVGPDLAHMQSLGRILLDLPGNSYANATGPYQYPAPANPIEADFDKPFTGSLSSFDGQNFSQIIKTLDGSVGGTWITIPANLHLADINYIRFSDPQWQLADHTYADYATSKYSNSQKPADLLLNAVWAVPEPATAALLVIPAAAGLLRRRRKA